MRSHSQTTVNADLQVIRAGHREPVHLLSPLPDEEFIRYANENRQTKPLGLAIPGGFKGKTVALCGAGPSLADTPLEDVDMIFACNSALPYLTSRGIRVSAGCGIDQTPGLLEEWHDVPDVPFYLASTCDPALVRHLTGMGRTVLFFHSAVGIPDEFDFYCKTWPAGMMVVGKGYTVTGRMARICEVLGFDRIDIYGADCALRGDTAHADGTEYRAAYGNPILMTGEIDRRSWTTRPDLLMEAVDLARFARDSNGRVRLMGDTLPAALLDKSDDFLETVCLTKRGEAA